MCSARAGSLAVGAFALVCLVGGEAESRARSTEELRAAARRVLEGNTRVAYKEPARRGLPILRFLRRQPAGPRQAFKYTVPSKGSYPHQWFWDSCFHAIAWSHYDRTRAADEIRSLMAWQRPDGFIPHVVFWDRSKVLARPRSVAWEYLESKPWMAVPGLRTSWGKPKTTEQIQPPVIAQAVEQVYARGANDRAFNRRAFLEEMVPKLKSYYQWLYRNRAPSGDGLIAIFSPSESGLDFSRAYDSALGIKKPPSALMLSWKGLEVRLGNKIRGYDSKRIIGHDGFVVKDVLVNTVLIEGLDSLSRLAKAAGDGGTERWAKRQRALSLGSLIRKAYDPRRGMFFNLNGRAERPSDAASIISMMPLVLPDLPDEIAKRLVDHLTDPNGFGLGNRKMEFPLPHAPRSDPEFAKNKDRGGAWKEIRRNRRDTWVMTNWWLEKGLRSHGYADLADTLKQRTIRMIDRAGFREFFDPETGKGLGAKQFGWSTLVVDMLPGGEAASRRGAL